MVATSPNLITEQNETQITNNIMDIKTIAKKRGERVDFIIEKTAKKRGERVNFQHNYF